MASLFLDGVGSAHQPYQGNIFMRAGDSGISAARPWSIPMQASNGSPSICFATSVSVTPFASDPPLAHHLTPSG